MRPEILIVDDINSNLLALKHLLKGFEADLITADSGHKALSCAISATRLALILLDVQMPEIDGYQVARLLKGEEQTKNIPIIFVTAISREEDQILKGYSYGAVDYLTKPIVPEILQSKVRVFLDLWLLRAGLQQEIEKRIEVEQHISYLAHHDELTGLPNRRGLINAFDEQINRATRFNKKVILLMIDLDKFKQVNDLFGHEAGDFTLREAAGRIKSLIRQYDTFARVGGDEFIVLMSEIENTDIVQRKIDQVILKKIGQTISYQGHSIKIGASVGMAIFPTHGRSIDELTRHADDAMYQAKQAGGNQLHIFNPLQ
ncbi:diguanylate cyclase domain-containing protein [Colwellia psychrerythraea]|uniref:Response regulator receiver modulated diguanylate cyclase n=1 Tax=Colwellia psychrerythraea TaxID=28229 RepID=A0A099KWC3_COLPS|nr:diguanylate cyclase [Colwellia psychrerythraea]KGJ93953.1 response regulator receiver modulated diguanylate cyclase [Colwellia psychrerythraea]